MNRMKSESSTFYPLDSFQRELSPSKLTYRSVESWIMYNERLVIFHNSLFIRSLMMAPFVPHSTLVPPTQNHKNRKFMIFRVRERKRMKWNFSPLQAHDIFRSIKRVSDCKIDFDIENVRASARVVVGKLLCTVVCAYILYVSKGNIFVCYCSVYTQLLWARAIFIVCVYLYIAWWQRRRRRREGSRRLKGGGWARKRLSTRVRRGEWTNWN